MAFAVAALAAQRPYRDRGHGGGRGLVPGFVRRCSRARRRDRGRSADATRPRVVAIDGAAGSGKSTLARGLARALGLPYVNTGLMYRALTRAALDREVDVEDEDALVELTRRLTFTVVDR